MRLDVQMKYELWKEARGDEYRAMIFVIFC